MNRNNDLPILLAHGIARFDILREIFLRESGLAIAALPDQLHYFRGIKTHLTQNGFRVFHSDVEFAGPVELRAVQLSRRVEDILVATNAPRLHIIAHSMGGLDSRHMIVDQPGMADKVASLTTIGTPHLGTSFADFGLTLGGQLLIRSLSEVLNLKGFETLTRDKRVAFNKRARNSEATNNVVYRAYGSFEERALTFLPLQTAWFIIHQAEGDNDGLVSLTSQLWTDELVADDGRTKSVTQVRFPVPADHLNQVGWWDPQETSPLGILLSPQKQAAAYESRIRQVYLDMAEAVARL